MLQVGIDDKSHVTCNNSLLLKFSASQCISFKRFALNTMTLEVWDQAVWPRDFSSKSRVPPLFSRRLFISPYKMESPIIKI
jgi:hypothetical protein